MPGVLPLAPIRNLLAQECSFHISDEAITLLRDVLENIIYQIGYESISEFERLNRNREQQGLRRLSRLNAWSIEKAAQKIINEENISYVGSEFTRTTRIRGPDDTMNKNACIIGPNATNDPREVV